MKKVNVKSALMLLLSLACRVSAGAPEKTADEPPVKPKDTKSGETYAASVPQSGGGWLKVNHKMHVDPEHQVAVVFTEESGKIARAWMVDLAEKKASKLCDLPQDVIENERYFVWPKYAALSADRKTLYLDKETREDRKKLPNGRPELVRDVQTKQQSIHALQRTIFAVPLNGDKAFAMAKGGDFNEWTYAPGEDRLLAVACENGKTGVVVIKPNGAREVQVGFRSNTTASTEAVFNGIRIPPGGSSESNPCQLGESFFTLHGSGLVTYARGSAKADQLTPFKSGTSGVLTSIAASPATKQIFLVATNNNGTAQVYAWEPSGTDAPKPLGMPISAAFNGYDHALCVAADGSALWIVVSPNTRGPGDGPVILRIHPKTGKTETVWTAKAVDQLVAKAAKDAQKK